MLAATALLSAAAPAWAKVFLTHEEALALAFPDCRIERRNVFLTADQLDQARELAGSDVAIESGLVYPYTATCDGELGGTAYLDTHRVRTLPETLMVVVDPEGKVRRLEILAFREPEDYIPPAPFYAQFLGRALSEQLRLKADIRGVTGATLTGRATTEAVRRVLALHAVIPPPKPAQATP